MQKYYSLQEIADMYNMVPQRLNEANREKFKENYREGDTRSAGLPSYTSVPAGMILKNPSDGTYFVAPQKSITIDYQQNSNHSSQNNPACDMPPWMTIAIEQAKEIGGRNEHQVDAMIQKYHNATDYNKGAGASSAWCASFVSWALKESGMENTPTRSGSRFFRDESENPTYGHGLKPIPKGEEKIGDIAVWADLAKNGEHKGSGHVSFVFGKDKNGDELFLGGNQGNTLAVTKYTTEDTEKRAFVGFFRPEERENVTACDLPQYNSVLQANQAAIGKEIEISQSVR